MANVQQSMDSQRIDQRVIQRSRTTNTIVRSVFMICAILLIAVIIAVVGFLTINGLKLFFEDPNSKGLLTGTYWDPLAASGRTYYGALGFIIGSLVTTVIAIIIVAPLSFGMALFMTELSPKWLGNILRPLLEVFTGMPSVVIGFLGLTILIPFISRVIGPHTPNPATAGEGWAAATLVLVVMVLPTVISISMDALQAVPQSVREASLALGSTRWQMMSRALIPAAASGLGTAVVLGIARAIGESLAVSMVLKGDQLPSNIFNWQVFFQPNVNLTSQIVLYFQNALPGTQQDSYFTLGLILLVLSFLFVLASRYLASRSVYQ